MKLPELWQASFDGKEITFTPLPDFEIEVEVTEVTCAEAEQFVSEPRFRWVGPWMDEMPAGIGGGDVAR